MASWRDKLGAPVEFQPTVPPFPFVARDTSLYVVDGVRVPSVTNAIQLANLVDFSRVRPEVLENAANRGKWAHHFCDRLDNGIDVWGEEMPEEVVPRVRAYQRFLDVTGFEVMESELPVVSQKYRFAGTLDRIGRFPRRLPAVLDLKLPKKHEPAWKLQTAGYQIAYEEQTRKGTIGRRWTLQLHETGDYTLTEHPDHAIDKNDFLAALRIAHFKLRNNLTQLED